MSDDAEQHAPHADNALAQAFPVLGKRWNGVILAALASHPVTYSELRRAVGSISDSVLSDRLVELVGIRLVNRDVRDGPPVSVTYQLTESGRALLPIFDDLSTWARDHHPTAEPR